MRTCYAGQSTARTLDGPPGAVSAPATNRPVSFDLAGEPRLITPGSSVLVLGIATVRLGGQIGPGDAWPWDDVA
eukprot:1885285-Pyramimonas_sp.AAC.1